MNRSTVVLGSGVVFLGIISLLSVVQGLRIQERMAVLERSIRDLPKASAAATVVPVAPPPSRLDERVGALEAAVRDLPARAPAAAGPAAPPASREFREAARGVYSRMREEEQADLVVGNWDLSLWPMISEYIQLEESQAAAVKAVFVEEGRRLKAFSDRARGEEGPVLGSIKAQDAAIRKAAYERIKPLLQPSQYFALKVWAGWECDPRERDVLERWDWKNLSRNFKFIEPFRPTFEEAIRQLHEVSDRNHGDIARAGALVAARERALSEAVAASLAPRLTDLELRALQLHFGLPVPPLLPPEPTPAPASK